jgi:hypothetical protein
MRRTAKIFMNNRSQAVRLPKKFKFGTREVFIRRQGDDAVLGDYKRFPSRTYASRSRNRSRFRRGSADARQLLADLRSDDAVGAHGGAGHQHAFVLRSDVTEDGGVAAKRVSAEHF